MCNFKRRFCLGLCLFALALIAAGCATQAKNAEYFGQTEPPEENVLRYISGSEPESLDPQVSTGQPEGRLYMSMFEGLVEYHPQTMEPIPSIAERWDVSEDGAEFVFHLRKNARWSNGDPITAHDFVYTFRRGLRPEFAARNAPLAYYVKYAKGFNEHSVFARDPRTGQFILKSDVTTPAAPAAMQIAAPLATAAAKPALSPTPDLEAKDAVRETAFRLFIKSPERLVLPGDEAARAKAIEANPKLKAIIAGKEFVPVKEEEIGVEAVDDHTFRVTLAQPAPYFVGMMAHQFFRVVPRKAIEKHGVYWTHPGNMISSGPFKLESWKPYNEVVVVRDPMYWDAANVHLDRIIFPAMEDITTAMNLYKAGAVDAVYNHSVPLGWIEKMKPLKDYMDAPEAAIAYYQINITKPPMNDIRVRRAFNLAIDKNALSEWKKVTKPLTAFSPEGIFPKYPQPKGADFDPERAKQLLAEAGYKSAQTGKFDPKKFPIDQVELTYNTREENKQVAEFVQAQWKQNLGLTVPLKNMEWKTFLNYRSNLEYKGFARGGWVADYMDPFTFLNIFYTASNDSGTGWTDPKYDQLLNQANRSADPQKRYELLAKAEAYLLEQQPMIPLYTNATNFLKKPYVKGFYPNPGTMHAWKFVYIERDPSKWDRS